MKGFKISENGDTVISGKDIQTISDNDLIIQTAKQVILTNYGEWFLNENEGMNVYCLLTKNPDFDEIRDNILSALLQIDGTFEISDFEHEINNRTLTIKFTAVNSSGKTINVTI